MIHTTSNSTDTKAERKARRRAEQAATVEGLRTILDGDEQLLAFARGKLAGGWKGKITVGLEAFFAPDINIGLTERRIALQHIHPENGKPSEILPHFFPLSDLASITFSDIETFGAEKACRLVLRFRDDTQVRVRINGTDNTEDAQALAEVFRSLTAVRATAAPRPTQTVCANCGQFLDQPAKFCPYCGHRQEAPAPPAAASSDPFVVPAPPRPPADPAPPSPPEPPPAAPEPPVPAPDIPAPPEFFVSPAADVTMAAPAVPFEAAEHSVPSAPPTPPIPPDLGSFAASEANEEAVVETTFAPEKPQEEPHTEHAGHSYPEPHADTGSEAPPAHESVGGESHAAPGENAEQNYAGAPTGHHDSVSEESRDEPSHGE